MAIRLDIGLEQLSAPGVAEALARLVGALSSDEAVTTAPATTPHIQSARRAPQPTPEVAAMSEADRYTAFIERLPARSRKFIDLVRTHKLLKISHAMRALDLTAPKAMGGLTGSIGRWAPSRGVKVPYETTTADGERAWRWLGSPLDEPVAPAQNDVAGYTPTVLPAPAAPPVIETAPPPAAPVDVPAAPVDVPAAPVVEAVDAADVSARSAPSLRDFADLPKKSQQFITLVAARGLISREDALEALGLRRPKELGGVTEPIVRLCREKGIERPYLAGRRDGKRVWLWPTAPVPPNVELS